MDSVSAREFANKNKELAHSIIVDDLEGSDGFSIAFAKGSPLVKEVNKVLAQLVESGELEKLEKKWKLND